MIKLSLKNKNDEVVIEKFDPKYDLKDREMVRTGQEEAYLGARTLSYEPGDYIELEVEKVPSYVWVQFDDTFEKSLVYIRDKKKWIYPIPTEEKERRALKEASFSGKGVYVWAKYATDSEIKEYQNLAFNRHATYKFDGVFPFAHANTETRDDPTFFARNAIDGIFANDDHGSYPYQSWGINQQDDAELTIEFGRTVEIDLIVLTLRADFPHDTWWNEVTIELSNGKEIVLNLVKTDQRQFFEIDPQTVTWVKMKNMKKGEPGPFPALSQIEVYGYNKLK